MSRSFDGNSYLIYDSTPPITDSPVTFAAFIYLSNVSGLKTISGVGSRVGDVAEYLFRVDNTSLQMYSLDAGASSVATSSATLSATTWYHACGVVASDTDRRCFVDGGNKGTASTSVNPNPGLFAALKIGSRCDDTWFAQKFNGNIAEYAIWNVALTDGEIASLSRGIQPIRIRPQNIVFYLPFVRNNDKDWIGGLSLTEAGAGMGVAAHPRIILTPPRPQIWAFPPSLLGLTVALDTA